MFGMVKYVVVSVADEPTFALEVGPQDIFTSYKTETIEIPTNFFISKVDSLNLNHERFVFRYSLDGEVRSIDILVPNFILHDESTVIKYVYDVIRERVMEGDYHSTVKSVLIGNINLFLQSFLNSDGQHTFVTTPSAGSVNDIAMATTRLPAMDTIVEYPCNCAVSLRGVLWEIVQHLNDIDNWHRDKIADWIDELHDAGIINAEFQPWNETGMEEK